MRLVNFVCQVIVAFKITCRVNVNRGNLSSSRSLPEKFRCMYKGALRFLGTFGAVLPSVLRKQYFRKSNTYGNVTKQRDFPLPFGSETNTFLPFKTW